MSKTYTARFRTDAEYAEHQFKADAPEKALRRARRFLATQAEDLIFEPYEFGMPVNEIAIVDAGDNELALWQDEDLRLRLAGGELLDAAKLALRELREFYSDGDSEALRALSAAVAKAKGSQP